MEIYFLENNGSVLLGCVIYALFFKKDYRLKLKIKENEVVIGQVTRTHIPTKSAGYFIDYKYNYGGRQYSRSRDIMNVIYSPERFVNRFFPVVLSKENASVSTILITPNDFAFFDKTFPDSLRWVVQFLLIKNKSSFEKDMPNLYAD